ncbi:lipopolysaccharide biosynthesis protein [Quadrisphaera sp. DSM 44207]|uniref:lipopolysaccharide biosynthesis protein n=1 Tax=Quadrisphaera sp. DSM 44207 TaxID=1881057 RepID=UPI0015A2292E|nr:lipopolysaccharide biosynthesis protein [Quadrisphaera sp. DSM 44207]
MPEPRRGPADAAGGTVAPPGTGEDLRGSAIDSVKWNFVATLASLVGRLVFTFALARLLGPENFGIVALATLYITFAVVVLDQGFGLALIQRRDLGPRDVGSVAWLNVAMGTLLTAVTIAAAPLAADFFDTPELTAVLRVLSVTLFIRGLTLVPQALIRRHLRFRAHAVVQGAAVLAGGVAGIAAALAGAQYWALVVQTIVNDLVVVTALMLMFRATSWLASWRSLRSMWSFSAQMMASNFLVYLGNNADNIIIGRVLNATELAFYALAYRLLRLPIQMVGSVVNGVALPLFARLQDDDARSASWFRTATQLVALVTFPAFGLLVIGADAGIAVAFGPAWAPAAAPLQAMAIAGVPMVVRMLLGPLATARAHGALVLRWSVITVGLQFVGFFVGLHVGGMVGVAVSIPVVQYLTWVPNAWSVLHHTVAMPVRTYLAALVPPTLGSCVAVALWWAAHASLQLGSAAVPDAVALLAATGVALAGYALVIRLAWPRTYRSALDVGVQMLRRRVPA